MQSQPYVAKLSFTCTVEAALYLWKMTSPVENYFYLFKLYFTVIVYNAFYM